MKFFLALFILSFLPLAMAEVSPGHVESMLEQMVRENVISAKEAEKAKIRMRTMNPKQWAQINEKAAAIAARSPASVPTSNNIEEVRNINLDGAQFQQIQDDIKKIVPEYRDQK
jgi:hypothetical protein